MIVDLLTAHVYLWTYGPSIKEIWEEIKHRLVSKIFTLLIPQRDMDNKST